MIVLVRTGYAIPYFIYPHAVAPIEKGEFDYENIEKMQDAVLEAQKTIHNTSGS